MPGKARVMSAVRMITESVNPPKYPASTPPVTPNSVAIATEIMPTRSEIRAP